MRKQRLIPFLGIPLAVVLTIFFTGLGMFSAPTQHAYAANTRLALTPPMGWNSWNKFACSINETTVKREADAMVSSGMKAAGYQYINIDDCWSELSRDSHGNLVANKSRFPSGIKALATYVHGKGLKLGIYSDAGPKTCAGYPGLYGHEQQDANAFASWGIDYIKVDWCNNTGIDAQTQYTKIGNALKSTGRSIVYSICNWGNNNVGSWGPSVGNLWRTTGDILPNWGSMISNFDSNATHASSAGPGHWNDPDMLEVGNGMSTTESQAHFSLWAISAAPLLSGNDLSTMTATTNSILTNAEVIAVDQDALGIQGTKVADNGAGLQVWAKRLSGSNTYAVALLNLNNSTANITVHWSNIGLSGTLTVRNLWTHSNRGSFSSSYTASVHGHDAVLLKVVK